MTVNSASCVSLSGPAAPLCNRLPVDTDPKVLTFLLLEEATLTSRVSRGFQNFFCSNSAGPGDAARSLSTRKVLAEYRSSEPVLEKEPVLESKPKKNPKTALDRIKNQITNLQNLLKALQAPQEEGQEALPAAQLEARRVAIENDIKHLEVQAIRTQSWSRFSESALDLIGDYLTFSLERTPVYTPRPSDPLTAIGTDTWNRVIGRVPQKLLSPKIRALLQERCPITGKTVGETHLPVIIPNQVDGSPYTLNRLIERAQNPMNGNKSIRINISWEMIIEVLGNVPIPPGEYLLFTGSLPGTKCKTYGQQLEIFEEFKGANPAYRVAGALEVLIPMMITYAVSGESDIRLFFNEYVGTSILVHSSRVVVGGIGSHWPCINFSSSHVDTADDNLSLAVVRHCGSSLARGI